MTLGEFMENHDATYELIDGTNPIISLRMYIPNPDGSGCTRKWIGDIPTHAAIADEYKVMKVKEWHITMKDDPYGGQPYVSITIEK